MKKEIIACALLLTLAAGCVCNIRYLNRLCTQLDDAAAQAEACCAAHDTDSAAEALRTAAVRSRAAHRPPRRTLPCCVCASRASPTGSASRSAMCFSRGR